MTYIILIFVMIWVAGELLPWFQLRSRGLSLSGREYFFSLFIKKSIFANKHNKKVFDALQTIQDNKLNIGLPELEEMYKANVDFQKFIDAFVLVKSRDIKISKEDLRELAYSKKDMMAIVSEKKPGEEIRIADIFSNKRPVLQK